jgi:hypothetical protein
VGWILEAFLAAIVAGAYATKRQVAETQAGAYWADGVIKVGLATLALDVLMVLLAWLNEGEPVLAMRWLAGMASSVLLICLVVSSETGLYFRPQFLPEVFLVVCYLAKVLLMLIGGVAWILGVSQGLTNLRGRAAVLFWFGLVLAILSWQLRQRQFQRHARGQHWR